MGPRNQVFLQTELQIEAARKSGNESKVHAYCSRIATSAAGFPSVVEIPRNGSLSEPVRAFDHVSTHVISGHVTMTHTITETSTMAYASEHPASLISTTSGGSSKSKVKTTITKPAKTVEVIQPVEHSSSETASLSQTTRVSVEVDTSTRPFIVISTSTKTAETVTTPKPTLVNAGDPGPEHLVLQWKLVPAQSFTYCIEYCTAKHLLNMALLFTNHDGDDSGPEPLASPKTGGRLSCTQTFSLSRDEKVWVRDKEAEAADTCRRRLHEHNVQSSSPSFEKNDAAAVQW
ncbi:hypothetical protein K440DRAFT_638966 [Wilcoxina mikolae CBS 423.85]|nr:hypothetical protein K440DRAFT_638966 [Wilcoxina mikolae CBS 423.85]